MRLFVQFYSADGEARIFYGNGGIGSEMVADIPSKDRAVATRRMRLLGLRPVRWRSTDWGYEATLRKERT